jgi:hypothetical protein
MYNLSLKFRGVWIDEGKSYVARNVEAIVVKKRAISPTTMIMNERHLTLGFNM